ncbi:MAG: polysaccharide biosynthesis/export family protein [Verrucomicrobia bacterium]|nr:polysaccharide biosynthesis/export family protein [Verrucomicrobiota bacterium]
MKWMIALCCVALVVTAGCGATRRAATPVFVPNDAVHAAASVDDSNTVIQAGDFVQIICDTCPTANSIGRVRTDGDVALALVGYVRAAGSTIEEFTQTVRALYGGTEEFSGDPSTIKVHVKLGLYLISGEVAEGGFRAYREGLTLYDAVVSGGKLTGKAEKGIVRLYRKGADRVELIRYGKLEDLANAPQNPLLENDWIVVPYKVYRLSHY